MTQNNQSVRNNAEAALNTNRIPTFEEVYAMPYVQESIKALLEQNVRRYPILASHEDDLKQEVLISLWKELPRFDARKSSLKTFVRMLLQTAFRYARRQFFSKDNLMLFHADDIADYDFSKEDSTLSKEKRQAMADIACESMDKEILRQDVEAVLQTVSPDVRAVAQRIMVGDSLCIIARDLGITHPAVKWRYLKPLRRAFEKIF